jgi:hypothetical protein
MKIVKLAAGFAVGYVLGSRAGREKYEQIVAGAAQLGNHPAVVQAKQKALSAFGTGTSPVAPVVDDEPALVTAGPRPRAPRRKPAPGVTPASSEAGEQFV